MVRDDVSEEWAVLSGDFAISSEFSWFPRSMPQIYVGFWLNQKATERCQCGFENLIASNGDSPSVGVATIIPVCATGQRKKQFAQLAVIVVPIFPVIFSIKPP